MFTRWYVTIFALLLLTAAGCGLGGLVGGEQCYTDPFGNYVCVGMGGKPSPASDTPCGFLAWEESRNAHLVIDANGDAVRFEIDEPHVMVINSTRVLDVDATPDGLLRWRGVEVGYVALAPGREANLVAVLTTLEGRVYDLEVAEGELVLRDTGESVQDTGLGLVPTRSFGSVCEAPDRPEAFELAGIESPGVPIDDQVLDAAEILLGGIE